MGIADGWSMANSALRRLRYGETRKRMICCNHKNMRETGTRVIVDHRGYRR
jgi:hypothetical protein